MIKFFLKKTINIREIDDCHRNPYSKHCTYVGNEKNIINDSTVMLKKI